MTPRDWTLTDQADAEDARRHREWWRHDPFAEHFDDRPEPEATADEGPPLAPQTPASAEFAGNGAANRTGADDTPGIPPSTPSVDPGA